MSKPTAFPLDESKLPFRIPKDQPFRENIAKGQCSIPELGLQGFDAISQCYNQIEQLAQALDKAQQSYQKAATGASRSVDNAETKLEQSQREDDTLTKLQTALENCTLTATMDGTITALDATVGAVCSGTVAIIKSRRELLNEYLEEIDRLRAESDEEGSKSEK